MWNDDWRMELERENEPMFTRLCECNSRELDIIYMAYLMAKYNKGLHTAEECLDRTIEWVVIWNNQDEIEINNKEYKIMLNKVLTKLIL